MKSGKFCPGPIARPDAGGTGFPSLPHYYAVRTLKVGDRITVYGDLEIVAVEGRRVIVRVTPASKPVMIPSHPVHVDAIVPIRD